MKLLSILILLCAVFGVANATVPPQAIQDLHWRLLGPLRAGWATCAEGIPDEPNTYYMGAADGGVWKTTDAGNTWHSISDNAPFSAVQTIAISASALHTVYVGTGQVDTRYDIMNGTGLYKTDDDGKTWTLLGLADSQHIGRILLDPRDPNVLIVAVLGHIFGPGTERGVFRSEDGGRTWKKTLFVDDGTGAVDLASDPATPDIVYAAMWQLRLYPWLSYYLPQVGPKSGIWKSVDGGKSWTQTSRQGLPDLMSRIGLAVASGTQGRRVYASVSSTTKGGGLYRSDDAGASWQLTNKDAGLASMYFGRLTPDPKDANTLYVMGRSVNHSVDGGKTFDFTKGAPGGDDYHFLWINPKHPDHMILAADQGATISVNGGGSWSLWYNQATGQFYHVAADNQFPYWVYSGQQDSGTVGVATRSDYGQLTFRDWHPVGGDERDYDLPDPDDPNIIYGSGLGGRLSKWDQRTGRVTNVTPTPIQTYGLRPTSVKYRYTWITPIAISPLPPHALYHGAQVLFRSLDKGHSWTIVSPDLSGKDPNAKDCEGDVPVERATACGYGVIFSIAPSPVDRNVMWIGTDNGRIQLTRDDTKTWSDVTPAAIQDWSKIATIDASPTDAATAYAAVDRHRLDDRHPYMYRTHDFGKTWTPIAKGLPEDSWVNVLRQDPGRTGLLYAGTRTGAFVSFDDGDSWQPLQSNLPATGVNDLLIHGADLIAATQGRSLWILDNISPLRELQAATLSSSASLLKPEPAFRLSKNENRDTPLPPDVPTTPNPPTGAILDYYLPQTPTGPMTLEILDQKGTVVRSFRSDDHPERPKADRYFADRWIRPLPVVPARAGQNRFVWDLSYPQPKVVRYEFTIAAVPDNDTATVPQGIQVLPGTYTVRLTVDGKTLTQTLIVNADPRSKAKLADMQQQLTFYNEVTDTLDKFVHQYAEAQAREEKLEGKTDPDSKREQQENDKWIKTVEALNSMSVDLESADGPPTSPQRDLFAETKKLLQ